jgi:hypothetical protein
LLYVGGFQERREPVDLSEQRPLPYPRGLTGRPTAPRPQSMLKSVDTVGSMWWYQRLSYVGSRSMPVREQSRNTRISPDRASVSGSSISSSSTHEDASASEIVDSTNLGMYGVVSLASCRAVPKPAHVATVKSCNNTLCSGVILRCCVSFSSKFELVM